VSDYPSWTDAADDGAPVVDVDYAALPDDWRARNYRVTSGDRDEHANIIRAQVFEGVIPPEKALQALAFADHLDRGAA
jgi:hypothetical protein